MQLTTFSTFVRLLFSMSTAFSWGIAALLHAQNIRLVNAAATGPGAGLASVTAADWNNTNAYVSLQAAIDASSSGDQVWVKAGTYKPAAAPTGCTTCSVNSYDFAFILKDGVKVYGGFAGTETLLASRDITANPTILSGDLGTAGVKSDNAYHVVMSVNDGAATELNGFTVRDGASLSGATTGNMTIEGATTIARTSGGGMYVRSSNPTIRNCTFTGNEVSSSSGTSGGAIMIHASSPTIENCTFTSNIAGVGGALRLFSSSSPTVTNCIFAGNTSLTTTATSGGGAVYAAANPVFTNCVFSGNTATSNGAGITVASPAGVILRNCTFGGNNVGGDGGAIYNDGAGTITVQNTIAWGNGGINEVSNTAGTLNYEYSLIEGLNPGGTNLNGTLASNDPDFVSPVSSASAPTTTGNYSLQTSSPALNAGNNSVVVASTDVVGATRIQNTTVDLGAYEVSTGTVPVEWLSFEAMPSGKDVLLTWTTASEQNNAWFTAERSSNGVDFEAIGAVSATGNSSSPTNYTYTDAALPAVGILHYRIRQTDMDGSSSHSEVRTVTLDRTSGLMAWPNPVASTLSVQVPAGVYTIALMDFAGRTVYRAASDGQPQILLLDLSDLAAGAYTLRADAASIRVVKK